MFTLWTAPQVDTQAQPPRFISGVQEMLIYFSLRAMLAVLRKSRPKD